MTTEDLRAMRERAGELIAAIGRLEGDPDNEGVEQDVVELLDQLNDAAGEALDYTYDAGEEVTEDDDG